MGVHKKLSSGLDYFQHSVENHKNAFEIMCLMARFVCLIYSFIARNLGAGKKK